MRTRRTLLCVSLALMAACEGAIGPAGNVTDPDNLPSDPNNPDNPDPDTPNPDDPPIEDGPVHPLRRLTDVQFNNALIELLGDNDWAQSMVRLRGVQPTRSPFHFSTLAERQVVTEPTVRRYMKTSEFLHRQAGSSRFPLRCDGAPSECADQFIEHAGSWMFRRPIYREEAENLRAIYDDLLDLGHDTAIRTVFEALILSPHFLYVIPPRDEGERSWSIAARLSLFLTNRFPDETLRSLAASGELLDPMVLRQQAERLVESPHARPMIHEFYVQLLRLDLLPGRGPGTPSAEQVEVAFGDFLDGIYYGEDASLEALFTAPHSFDGTSLASSYGVATYPGLLGQPWFTWFHSKYRHSDPIHRGVVVREQLLCQHLPPPPPDVEATLPEVDPNGTTRERFAAHREDPTCANCHELIDPIGFGFEAFDQMGRFRDSENDNVIDSSGELSGLRGGGGLFDGVAELGAHLAAAREAQECIVSQWATYAYGREMRPSDGPRLRELQDAFDASGHDLRELLLAIATSEAITGEDPNP